VIINKILDFNKSPAEKGVVVFAERLGFVTVFIVFLETGVIIRVFYFWFVVDWNLFQRKHAPVYTG